MNRRQFLKWTGFVTVSTVGPALLVGCSSNDDDAVLPAVVQIPCKFPQSIASGDPAATSIMLWTRVVPSDADDVISTKAADIGLRLVISSSDQSALLGSNKPLTSIVHEVALTAKTEWDHTIRHKVEGLNPATTYFYQFIAGNSMSRVGRFKTAPAVDVDVNKLRFAYLSCQDWSINHWAGFTELAKEQLDFVVHLGDYIYETVGEDFQKGAVEALHTAIKLPDGPFKNGKDGARFANSTADYRTLYKQYRSDARLQAVHERFAMIAIWDDHEFSDDCWGDATTYDNGSFDATSGKADNKHETERRRSANQAWFEFMPADVKFDITDKGFQNIHLYRDFRFGKLLHLVMTDQRLYRADHVIPEAAAGSSVGSRYMVPTALLAAAEAKKMAAAKPLGDELALVSILGKTQRDWWQNTMKASTATWKLWGNEVSLLKMCVNGKSLTAAPKDFQTEIILNADQWDGYNAERKALMQFLSSNQIKNVVAITGDIHSFYAGQVYDDYTSGKPVMIDLVTAGISSDSFYSYFAKAVSDPASAAVQPLIFTSEAAAEGIAIQMISAGIAMQAGLTDLSNTTAIKAAVGGAIANGLLPAAAVTPTAGLSSAAINTFNETLAGQMGELIGGQIAALAAAKKSVAAQTLYGMVAGQLAAALKIPVASVPAAEVIKRLNPFANQAAGTAPAANNPWIKYADTDAQGYTVVELTAAGLKAEFRKITRLEGNVAPQKAIEKSKTILVKAGSLDLTITD
ncbi:alkaline phosphatase [Iodobacter sp.]|uniref:alkaline phosphatase D family protein n=1 Tax=Iodobacter sp. TaxID=1915058 RepID=UPI0025CDEC5F|nr:alkaline phosphatase D family protein [Iodobacter sp.]